MSKTIIKNKYEFLTPAEVQPKGWLYTQLKTEAEGLAGNLDRIWPDVRDSRWIGGTCEGWERVPYWLDGFIPLAYLLRDEDMIARAKKYIHAILAGQRKDGWICPCDDENRAGYDMWALLLITKVLVVYADAEPAEAETVERAVSRALRQAMTHLGEHPLFDWGRYRWFEGLIAAYWLYERTHEDWILDYCDLLHAQGKDYNKLIDEEFEAYKLPERKWQWDTHVVNLSMALKADTLWQKRAVIGNADDVGTVNSLASKHLYETLMQYHGMATGHFTGDECLAGRAPIQGTELCGVVEAMYSDEWLLAITGDTYWGDLLERLAFNALPATISRDMWSHQYDQQINQIACAPEGNGFSVFGTNGAEANTFGLEPNYGCCTANMPQGWPKFALSAFMKNDDAVFSASPVPTVACVTIHSIPVRVACEGGYPFRDSVVYRVTPAAPVEFSLDIRIPGFAVSATVDGEAVTPGSVVSVRRVWDGEQTVSVSFGFAVTLDDAGYEDLKCINRGPLLYSLPIGTQWIKKEYVRNGVERKAPYCDWLLYPTTRWGYAFDGAVLDKASFRMNGVLSSDTPVFCAERPPVTISVPLVPIDWGCEPGFAFVAAKLPASREPLGAPEVLDLIPYGCTDLRMTALPVIG
ncbi:MAG: glycoside hydrolase family 127 protein [Clostridia bacterium]|nr:glycoside hydrolase family 127 protein [Clostridia bacterium]